MKNIGSLADTASIDSTISEVSGIDTLGRVHGGALSSGTGSATETLKSFSEQLEWLANGIQSDGRAIGFQEMFNAAMLFNTDKVGYDRSSYLLKESQPDPGYKAFEISQPFPSAPSSVDELARQFGGTKTSMITSAVDAWTDLAQDVGDIAKDLNKAARDFVENNQGYMFDSAAKKIREIGLSADVFAGNAKIMSATVGALGAANTQGAMFTSLAQLAMAFAPTPLEKEAIEKAFLSSFPGIFRPMLIPAVPLNSNLMEAPDLASGALASIKAQTSGANADLSKVALPSPIQELVDKGTIGPGAFEGAREQFEELEGISEIHPSNAKLAKALGVPIENNAGKSVDALANVEKLKNLLEGQGGELLAGLGEHGTGLKNYVNDLAKGVGAPYSLDANGLPISSGTQTVPNGAKALDALQNAGSMEAASVSAISPSAGHLPAGLGMGSTVPGAGVTANAASMLPQGGISASMSQSTPGLNGMGAMGSVPPTTAPQPGGRSFTGAPSAGRPPTGLHTGTSNAQHSQFGRAGLSSGLTHVGPGTALRPGYAPAGVTGPAAGVAAGNSSSGQANSGRSPMYMGGGAGAPGAGGMHNGKRGRGTAVKTVVNRVERSRNKRDLLGEPQPVVPGVIGAWVRD
ncbi:hypothetical protein H0194_00010 [Corynebacterium incognita]|uniref:PPE family protein n=1 Tax=Corynebacterium incognita TaxID=2754725 RepID=A0A7G7CPJ0_9CORY|nr:hypothetical protein [Corynebacterium incognita]QNE89506.1 hypothetical protein H0194_00010 [Corynebacterium incognita]